MFRKFIISAGVVLSLFVIATAYFFLQKQTIKSQNPLYAIGQEAALVLQTGNGYGLIHKFLNENIFWDEFATTVTFSDFHKRLFFIDSVSRNDAVISEWLAGRELQIAVFPAKRNKPGILMLLQAPSSGQVRKMTQKISSLAGKDARVSSRNVKGVKINDVEFREGSRMRDFSFASSNGLLLLSSDRSLLENSLEVIDSQNSIFHNEAFKRVYSTAGKNVDANVFINYRNFSTLAAQSIAKDKSNVLPFLSTLSGWGEMDLHIRNDGILLNGFSFAKSMDEGYLNVFLRQDPQKMTIDRLVPVNAAAFIALGISNPEFFRADYLDYLVSVGRIQAQNEKLDQVIEEFRMDLDAVFYEFMDKEIAAVFFETGRAADKMQSALIVSVKSRSMAQTALSNMLEQFAKSKNRQLEDYIRKFQFDSETIFEIYEMPVNYTGEILFGDLFSGIETRFFTFFDNYLLFGSSYEGLTYFVREAALNKTLQTNIAYRKFSETISGKSNLYFYLNLENAKALLSGYLEGSAKTIVSKDFETLRKIQAVTLQFSSGRNMIYQNLYAGYRPYLENKPLTTWETVLDAAVNFKPYLVRNHNTGENEIFIQDILNNIYLINRNGQILWKKQLPESIQGEVFQIDYYKNRKLQYLFNTKHFIYLVDRNGDFVDRFPVRLPSPATSPLAVFDYDRTRDYRLFITSEDRNVYAFTKEGAILKGWEFQGTENLVSTPVQHIKIGTRDYIVVADKYRIYILDRRGNHRVKVQGNFQRSENNPVVFEPKTARSDPRLVTTDEQGNVWFVYFDGKMDSMRLGNYSSGHFFDYLDMDANGYRDFIFIDGNRLNVYRNNRTKLFSYQFVHNIETAPAYYQFSAHDRKLGVVDRKDNQIYLFNGNGSIYRGFPLKGRSPFTIGYLKQQGGSFNLLVGSEGNLLYNYTVK